MRLTRSVATALLALALAGCGGSEPASSSEPAGELLAEAASALRNQATFSFSFEYVRTRADRPDDPERYAHGDGALDLATGRGRLRFELDLGLPPVSGSSALEEQFELRWSQNWFEAEVAGEPRRVSRDRARAAGGLLGRLSDEPETLVVLLERARDPRHLRDGELDGRPVAVVGFTVDAREAGRLGVPAEVSRAAEAGSLGDRLELETWIDDERLPRRIALTLAFEPVARRGKVILPERTVEIAYELDDFGEPVTGLHFESQAG